MFVISSEYRDRIVHWIRTLREDLYEPVESLHWEVLHTQEPLSLSEAEKGNYQPVSAGYQWGSQYEYAWFRAEITIPKQLDGQTVVVDLQPGGESTVFVNGKAFGAWRADWIKYPHHYLADNYLTTSAHQGDQYVLYMEVYAGHYYTGMETPACATGPILPGLYADHGKDGSRVLLGNGTFGLWDETAYQLLMDVEVLNSLLQVLEPESLRAAHVADALETFTRCVDFEQDRAGRDRDYVKAREMLAPALTAHNGTTVPSFSAVGNSHLDLAWLWPVEVTRRKTARTFAAQLRLLDRYPEYIYIQSQPEEYELCRQSYPELFAGIQDAVKSGRWIAEGAMWVEPDTNLAGAEALVRQILYGKQYYRKYFNVDSRILWLPDTFGYSAALPQILKKSGIDYLVTQKIFWSYNEGEPFPYHYFNWEGLDGSSVEAFLPTRYDYDPSPEEMVNVWRNRRQKRNLDDFLIPFGYGDGGGGPARDHIEMIRRQSDLEGDVRMRMESPLALFDRLHGDGGPSNTYEGELYFTAHRGTYTGQANIKKLNRRTEVLLREYEFALSLRYIFSGISYDPQKIGELWKILLKNQFHDILPGSAIHEVYVQAEKELDTLDEKLSALTDELYRQLLPGSFSCWNTLTHSRTMRISLPEDFRDVYVSKGSGQWHPVPVYHDQGKRYALVDVPGLSSVILKNFEVQKDAVSSGGQEEKNLCAYAARTVDGFVMENESLRVELDRKGQLTSFVLNENETDYAGGIMNRFRLFKDVPRKFDAWDIDSNYREQEIHALEDPELRIVREGGLQAVLELTGTIGNSCIRQNIILAVGSCVLTFDTWIDWKETHRLLKVEARTNILAEKGMSEIQFGFIERPAVQSRPYEKERFEVCGHRWSALREENRGFAVLNDSKYGISMENGALSLSLLTAATCPDDQADRHMHHFRYGYTAWSGSFCSSGLIDRGYEFCIRPHTGNSGMSLHIEENSPPAVRFTKPYSFDSCSMSGQLIRIDSPSIFLEAMKLAEDGSNDLILRLYEGCRTTTAAAVAFHFHIEAAWECDLLENIQEEFPVISNGLKLQFKPFEVKTVRIRI